MRSRKLRGWRCKCVHALRNWLVSKYPWSKLVRHVLGWDSFFTSIERLFDMRSWNIFAGEGGECVRFLLSWNISSKHRLDELLELQPWGLWAHARCLFYLPLMSFWVLLCWSRYELYRLRNWDVSIERRHNKLCKLSSWKLLPHCRVNFRRWCVHCWVLLRIVCVGLRPLPCRHVPNDWLYFMHDVSEGKLLCCG